jgi:hypothetical protein
MMQDRLILQSVLGMLRRLPHLILCSERQQHLIKTYRLGKRKA